MKWNMSNSVIGKCVWNVPDVCTKSSSASCREQAEPLFLESSLTKWLFCWVWCHSEHSQQGKKSALKTKPPSANTYSEIYGKQKLSHGNFMATILLILGFLRWFKEHLVNLQQEQNEREWKSDRALLVPFHVKFPSYHTHSKYVILFSCEK